MVPPPTTPSCFGQNTGTIVINIIGGVGPNYTFSDGVHTPVTVASPNFTFTNEAAGTYSVSVTDSNNCTITQQNVLVASDNFLSEMARHLQLRPVLTKVQAQSLLTLRVAYLITPSFMVFMHQLESFPNFLLS